jgi:hypothetical protein
MIIIEITHARTGRSMKKRASMTGLLSGERRGVSLKFTHKILPLRARDQVTQRDCQFFQAPPHGPRGAKLAKAGERRDAPGAGWAWSFLQAPAHGRRAG